MINDPPEHVIATEMGRFQIIVLIIDVVSEEKWPLQPFFVTCFSTELCTL